MRTLSTIALATAVSVFAHAEDASTGQFNLAEVYGNAALVGLQLGVQKSAGTGQISSNIAACMSSLPTSTFNPVFDAALKDNLSPAEISAATEFFSSAAGQKYSKTAILQIYRGMGMDAPEKMPEFSGTEYAELTKFTHTSAGDKLIMKRILEAGAAHQAMGEKVKELLHSCNDQVGIAKR